MVIKPFGFDVVIRDVIAGVRCALQEFIVFAPVPPFPPTPMLSKHDCVESVAGKAAGPQVPRVVGSDPARIAC